MDATEAGKERAILVGLSPGRPCTPSVLAAARIIRERVKGRHPGRQTVASIGPPQFSPVWRISIFEDQAGAVRGFGTNSTASLLGWKNYPDFRQEHFVRNIHSETALDQADRGRHRLGSWAATTGPVADQDRFEARNDYRRALSDGVGESPCIAKNSAAPY